MVILKDGDFGANLFVGTPIMCVGIVFALCFVMWLFVFFLACQSCDNTKVVLPIVCLFLFVYVSVYLHLGLLAGQLESFSSIRESIRGCM